MFGTGASTAASASTAEAGVASVDVLVSLRFLLTLLRRDTRLNMLDTAGGLSASQKCTRFAWAVVWAEVVQSVLVGMQGIIAMVDRTCLFVVHGCSGQDCAAVK